MNYLFIYLFIAFGNFNKADLKYKIRITTANTLYKSGSQQLAPGEDHMKVCCNQIHMGPPKSLDINEILLKTKIQNDNSANTQN